MDKPSVAAPAPPGPPVPVLAADPGAQPQASAGTRTARDRRLDLMRFFGILVVIIAHAHPPEWLFQLRNFGTPLLVAASALTYATIYQSRPLHALPFLRKRLAKLILPAWGFLTFFFALFACIAVVTGQAFPFPAKKIVTSYAFYSGIGYVWIFKVYIALALITPAAIAISKRHPGRAGYFATLVAVYAAYEVALPWVPADVLADRTSIIHAFVLTLPPYMLLFLYGLKMRSFTDRQLLAIGGTALTVFLAASWLMARGGAEAFAIQDYKYPPRAYYLVYGFAAIHFIYLACRHLGRLASARPVAWVAENSLWIYLWHILAIYIWRTLDLPTEEKLRWFIPDLLFLLGFGIALTYLQGRVSARMPFRTRTRSRVDRATVVLASPVAEDPSARGVREPTA